MAEDKTELHLPYEPCYTNKLMQLVLLYKNAALNFYKDGISMLHNSKTECVDVYDCDKKNLILLKLTPSH